MKKIIFLIIFISFNYLKTNAYHSHFNTYLTSISAPLQKSTNITGQVLDSAGQGIPKASITIKETKKGMITDENGSFQLQAHSGQTLVISMIGYLTKEVKITTDSTYTIVLQTAHNSLGEVVVTALGLKKEKSKLGYAVQEIKGEAMVKAREPNIISSMTGRVAGLIVKNNNDLFQSPAISLRGRQPLIVIDGIPDQTADLYRVNADDVKSMSILKGAAASALYGSIGQNGAIMITTKRADGKSFNVDFNSSTQVQTGYIRIPKVQTTYGNGDVGKYAYVNGSGKGTEGGGWIWGPKLDQKDPNSPSGFFETQQYNSPIDPSTGNRMPIPFISRGVNNIKNFFQSGIIASNNVSITSSSEKGTFRASLSNIYQKGMVPNTSLNNTSFNISGNYNLTNALSIDTRFSYNKINSPNFPEVGYGPTNYLYNLVLWTGADVDVRDLKNYWVPGKEGFQQRHFNLSYYNNPYFQANEYIRKYDKDNSFGSLDLNYKINSSLSAKFRTGINAYSLSRDYREPKSYIGYGKNSRGQYQIDQDQYFDMISDVILNYKHSFNKNFNLNSQIGGSNYFRTQKYGSTLTDGLNIPGKYNLSNTIGPITATNFLEERRTSSVYAVVDAEFYKAFFVSLTGRNDWISTLPIQNNSFFYPSISSSLLISELISLPKAINYLKLRSGFSRVSSGTINNNNDNYTYNYLPVYQQGQTWNGMQALQYGPIYQNSNLKPQSSDSWEIGIESKLFKNNLGIDFTYYQAKDFNNILQIPVSTASGFSTKLENGNVYLRKGFELMLSLNAVKSRDFRWSVGTNFSRFRRYLTEIIGNAPYLGLIKKGERADQLFTDEAYQSAPNGAIIYGPNGMPVLSSFPKKMGYQDPDWVFGIENTFNYKNFSLKVLIDGRIGGMLFSRTNQKMWWGGIHPGTVNQFRDDAIAGKNTYIANGVVVTSGAASYDNFGHVLSDTRQFAPNTTPVNYISYMQTTSNNANENYNYFSQSFAKLREITLSYQLSSKWLKKSFIKNGSVSLVGRNLFLISKLPNVDPDSGMDDLQSPSTRNFGINLNLNF